MIDIHSHIIFGVDDGPCTMEQSVGMVHAAINAGIKTIVATPHSQETLFETERLTENYQELLFRIRDCDIALKLGYEVFINPSMPGMDKKNSCLTLDKTRYILFEFPFNSSPKSGLEVLSGLRQKETIPILAHPERNRSFLKSFAELSAYIKAGCMIQIDVASILGIYGREVKEFVKKLVKSDRVDFIASNAHCAEDYADRYLKAYREVTKWVGDENADRLFQNNAECILNREEAMNVV